MKKCLYIGLGLLLLAQNAQAATTPQVGQEWTPGTQLNQTREYLEQQRLLARLEKEKQGQEAIEQEAEPAGTKESSQLRFALKQVTFDNSLVLTKAELDGLAKPYIGKTVNVKELYDLVAEVNKLYNTKGYVVCKAILPPQTIKDGLVYIRLIEGRTGNIEVFGNKSTARRYITSRIGLKPGEVSNLKELNQKLLWFNGTNDAQLHIKLKAGAKPGTTDYELTAAEPRRTNAYVLVDTAGSQNTGIWRYGIGWMDRSLFGNRDSLLINGMASQGTRSGGVSYSTPISKSGTRLGAQYSANSVKITSGDMEPLDVRGHAALYGFSLNQPLYVSQKAKVEAEVDYDHQHSATDFEGMHWLDDTIKKWTGSLAFTHYGKNFIWYHKHSYSHGNWEDIAGSDTSFNKYNLNLVTQYALPHRQSLTGRLNLQLTGTSYLPSAEQFYIGGVNSVRGYKESLLSGDRGLNASLEWAFPASKRSEWVYFFDYGQVGGDSAFDDNTLMGTGLGYRTRLGNWGNASLYAGVPLKRTINEVDQSSIRLHFMLYGQF